MPTSGETVVILHRPGARLGNSEEEASANALARADVKLTSAMANVSWRVKEGGLIMVSASELCLILELPLSDFVAAM